MPELKYYACFNGHSTFVFGDATIASLGGVRVEKIGGHFHSVNRIPTFPKTGDGQTLVLMSVL